VPQDRPFENEKTSKMDYGGNEREKLMLRSLLLLTRSLYIDEALNELMLGYELQELNYFNQSCRGLTFWQAFEQALSSTV